MHDGALTPASFIGRSQEIDEIGALLADPVCRLLTLVGPGGIGKTRLAMEAVTRHCDGFPDGVFFVPLAPLSRADDILTAVADAMPFRFQQDDGEPREQFFDYLREKHAKRILLVMDNFEHLLDGADIAADMLAATGGLKILATSREALNLQEEWVRQIAGMTYPDLDDCEPLEAYSAVQLFLDRARRIRGDFDLDGNSSSVAEICRLVEGMPLAIELAAGWLKSLQPADIADEIRHGMDILATRSRNLPERHRSIRSVFDHSWRLLSEGERGVFQKLSVFRGGFTREAADVVGGASLHTQAGLVDKSLVRLNAAGRYDVHELLRQYGAEHLNAAGQTSAVERVYSEYYLGLLHRLERDIKAHQQIEALDAIEADFENVRSAWQLAVRQGYTAALSQAVESLHFFGDMRGRYHEVIALLRAAVDQRSSSMDDAQAYTVHRIQARLIRLILLGNIRIDADVRAQIDACLAAARARQDQAETGFCLMVAGIVAVWQATRDGDPYPYTSPEANRLFEASYAVAEALGDPFYKAEALAWMASTVPDEPSAEYLMRSLDLRCEIDDRNGIAWITLNLTEVMLGKLDYVQCERYAREALGLMREIGSLKGILQSMFKLAQFVTVKGDLEEARALADEIRDLADATSNIDGEMVWASITSFLTSVIDENYVEGAALAQKSHAISQEPYFGGHASLGGRWGQAVADCGLGRHQASRLTYASLFWDRSDDPAPATVCLALEAAARADEGRLEDAAELLGLAFYQPDWASGWLHRWPLMARLRADLARQLGAAAFQAAWERGCSHDLQAIVQPLLAGMSDTPRPSANHALIEPLSERELEVLGLIRDGLSNREIAERLYLSVGTVKVHTRNIYGKLNVNSRTQALAHAARINLL